MERIEPDAHENHLLILINYFGKFKADHPQGCGKR